MKSSAAHCLVVVPEAGIRRLLVDLLAGDDVVLYATDNEREAMAWLTDGMRCDVVICPAPGTSKGPLLGRVRQTPATASLPVICVATDDDLQERAHAYDLGASEYLVRPLSAHQLRERMRHWSRRAHHPY